MSAVGGVNSPGLSPIFNLGGTKLHTRPLLSQHSESGTKQLWFISDIGSRANSSFSVVRTYVSACVYTV